MSLPTALPPNPMPPQLLFDLADIDLDRVILDQEAIRGINPHRGDMEHLNGINWFDDHGRIVGYKDVRHDEFWVPGHIPGRPILPGVLMIEAAAQISSLYIHHVYKKTGFVGFGGVESCKFRLPVTPGCRLYLMVQQSEARHRRFTSQAQGLVNGQVVFETTIVGTIF